jgi:hypothetical protein
VITLAVGLAGSDDDKRMKGQALGLLFNVIGFTANAPPDAEDDDDFR